MEHTKAVRWFAGKGAWQRTARADTACARRYSASTIVSTIRQGILDLHPQHASSLVRAAFIYPLPGHLRLARGVWLYSCFDMNDHDQHQIAGYARQLQSCSDALAQGLLELNRMCLGTLVSEDALAETLASARALLGDRGRARLLLAAHGKTSWPGSYGQSPYGEIFALVALALAGQAMRRGCSGNERRLHAGLFDLLAPAAARARVELDASGRERRYARVLFGMREAAILTRGEADAALRQLLGAHPSEREQAFPACEAVANFGGNLRVLQHALRRRPELRLMRARQAKLA